MKADEPGLAAQPPCGWPAPHAYDTERQWLEVLAEREILRLRARYELSLDELRGLYISDRQVDALLRARGERIVDADPGAGDALRDPLEALAASAAQWRGHFSRSSPLQRLAQLWPLSPLQTELVLLALAPDLDLRFENLWGYLNNDIGRRHLTLDLATRLLERQRAAERAELAAALQALAEAGLLDWLDPGAGRSRLAGGYHVAPLVLRFLLGELVSQLVADERCGCHAAARTQWTWHEEAAPAHGPAELVLLFGDSGQHRAWAQAHARERRQHLLWSAGSGWPGAADLQSLALQARLAGAIVALEPAWAAAENSAAAAERRDAIAQLLARGVSLVLCLPRGGSAGEETAGLPQRSVQLARSASGPLPQAQIPALSRVATRMTRRHDWSQLVLAPVTLALFKEVAAAISHRHTVHEDWQLGRRTGRGQGLAVLFSGPSGTGKTMAACVLAQHSGRALYRVDLAGVVSKYIGETEKNLERVFNAARGADAILLFDEADAILGKRSEVKDAHDRYANLEVAYLLQRLEEHDGVVILASNLPKNIDLAFARRLHYVVEFPRPGPELRERIWRGILAPPTPTAQDVDCAALAEAFELTGGEIQNLVLEAAFAAAARGSAIDQGALLRVLQRQQTRQGKTTRYGARMGVHEIASAE